MSIINFTLIIQAIHFFIAYYIIKYFFFAPVVNQIDAENRLQESLVTAVQEYQMAVSNKEKELEVQWQAMRDYFAGHIPEIKQETAVLSKLPEIVVPSGKQMPDKSLMAMLATQLIKRIKHVS